MQRIRLGLGCVAPAGFDVDGFHSIAVECRVDPALKRGIKSVRIEDREHAPVSVARGIAKFKH